MSIDFPGNYDIQFDEGLMNLTAEVIRSNEKETSFMEGNLEKINIGLDIGTMNIVAAMFNNDNQVNAKSIRNLFLPIDANSLGTRDMSSISHTIIDDTVYILSEDAYTFGNIFNRQVSRPMSKGMINSSEIDSIDILSVMIGSLIGQPVKEGAICCYSIPANPIDAQLDVSFHDNVFKQILMNLGYIPMSLNEATAIVYSECANDDFSGIAISFGAGMTNISIVFKGVQTLAFSVARGGDWIDSEAAKWSNGIASNRVTLIKEKQNFSLIDKPTITDKKEKRVREVICHYYNELIHYSIDSICSKLSSIEVDFPSALPIVVSGGTSRAHGFIDKVKEAFLNYNFPFEISDIRQASDPMTAVAQGCLIKSYKN